MHTPRYRRRLKACWLVTVLVLFPLGFVTDQVSAEPDDHKPNKFLPDKFLFGASVYPDLMPRQQWLNMLDHFQKAHMNAMRINDSSWGNLEIAPGEYNFGWLRQALDDMHERGMKAILGTSSYVPPQWFYAAHPEALSMNINGAPAHPMKRKVGCYNSPVLREAVRKFVTALAEEFKDHPAVIGWQLDNEIEYRISSVCHNPECIKAWHKWLKNQYHTVDELNEKLLLKSWGMEVAKFEDVLKPTSGGLAVLNLAHLRFNRDSIFSFLGEQTKALRDAGAKQWTMHDWIIEWLSISDGPQSQEVFDLSGINFYPAPKKNPGFWVNAGWHFDQKRSTHDEDFFLVTETTIGSGGSTRIWNRAPRRDHFRMWMLQPVAFGSCGTIYWTSNRWHGGHWPHWGGLLDWTGQTELDFEWVIETGEFFSKWSDTLLKNPVQAEAVVLTDFDNRSALHVYPHASQSYLPVVQTFQSMHRWGIGVDAINSKKAADWNNLKKYFLVVIPAATALDGSAIPAALKRYVERGGKVLISPFTAYQSFSGIFRNDGFAANLSDLTGSTVRTLRCMGTSSEPGLPDQYVIWKPGGVDYKSPVGIDGTCEIMEVGKNAQIIAKFESDDPLMDGRPAATRKTIGQGTVIKLAFWPRDDSVGILIRQLVPRGDNLIKAIAPAGVQAVPRSDKSMFIVNTTNTPKKIKLIRTAKDRITGQTLNADFSLPAYGVYWLE